MTDQFGPARVLIERAPFRVGVLARSAAGETLLEHDADAPYPAASVIKIPLVMTLYAGAAEGRLAALRDCSSSGVSLPVRARRSIF